MGGGKRQQREKQRERSAGFMVQSSLRWKPVTSTTREAEAGGSQTQGLTGLWSVIKDSLKSLRELRGHSSVVEYYSLTHTARV